MISLCLKLFLIMSFSGTKFSKPKRPTFDMYTTTLITLRDLSRDCVYRSGSCQKWLLDLRKHVEVNFQIDFGPPAISFINLMYDSSNR